MVATMSKYGGAIGAGCGGCLLLIILVFILAGAAAAKTGLVSVPVFSGNYKTPEPTRVVDAPRGFGTVQQTLTQSVAASVQSGTLSIELTEEMLTALVRVGPDLPSVGADIDVDMNRAQVVVLEEQVEVFVPIQRADRETALTIWLEPTVTSDGSLAVEQASIAVGNLRIPVKRVTRMITDRLNALLDSQFAQMQGAVHLTDVQLEDGRMRLLGTISARSSGSLIRF